MSHLVIVDGHHLMYRAYWAIPRTLRTSAGEQNNAVFGVASMLLTILAKEQPETLKKMQAEWERYAKDVGVVN